MNQQQSVKHCTEQINPGQVHKDGMLDATILENSYVRSGTLYLIPHGLGRVVTGYQVIFTDKSMGTPWCGRDAAGLYINDAEQIGLYFDVANANIRMRFF